MLSIIWNPFWNTVFIDLPVGFLPLLTALNAAVYSFIQSGYGTAFRYHYAFCVTSMTALKVDEYTGYVG
jgi:hypothetical protein